MDEAFPKKKKEEERIVSSVSFLTLFCNFKVLRKSYGLFRRSLIGCKH